MLDRMSKDATIADATGSHRTLPILLAAGLAGLLVAGTAALWAHYGTAVFFETVRAGFIACFG